MSKNIPNEVRSYLSSYKYKLELHAHTSPVSPCSELSPSEVVQRLHEKGYHGVVIANHFQSDSKFMASDDPVATYLADYYAAKEAGERLGMKVYLGVEYLFDETAGEFLVLGATEELLRETVNRLNITYEEFHREYHGEDLLIVQAHPFRPGMTLAAPDSVDGIEAFNMHPHHNSRVALAARYADENGIQIITAGTDLHNPGYEGLCATRTRVLPETSKELISILRSGDYLLEIAGHPLFPYTKF